MATDRSVEKAASSLRSGKQRSSARSSPEDRRQDSDIADLRSKMEMQVADNAKIYQMIMQLSETSTIQHILVNGFEKISGQLDPLRDIAPHYESLPTIEARKLRTLIAALARPATFG